jgi:hypothetical protein
MRGMKAGASGLRSEMRPEENGGLEAGSKWDIINKVQPLVQGAGRASGGGDWVDRHNRDFGGGDGRVG